VKRDLSQQGTSGGVHRSERGAGERVTRALRLAHAFLREQEDRLLADIEAALREQLPALGDVADDSLRGAIRFDYRRALAALAGAEPPADPDAAERLMAQCGPAERSAARRIGIRRAWELLGEESVLADVDEADRLEGLYAMWEWADATGAEEAALRWRAERRDADGGGEERERFLRALVGGTLAPGELRSRASAYGLLPGGRYLAVRARAAGDSEERALAREIEATGGDDGFGVLLGTVDGDLCGVVSRLPRVGGAGVAGVGFEADLPRVAESFRMATRALETAIAFGLAGVVTMDDLSLRPAILSEPHLGDRLVRRYFEPLAALGDFGSTIEATVRSYLSHGMRIDESARSLFIHPNTLRHRLDRFQQLTGADLRSTQDVAELWWALERRRLDQHAA
jgi:hypothetical protein